MPKRVFVTGGTGYVGSRLISKLVAAGHDVTALARPGADSRLPAGCHPVIGDALDGASYLEKIKGCDTFVQLVGVAHPSPAKAKEFEAIDKRSGLDAIRVAKQAGIKHFVYVSVAHPAPLMHAYIAARSACEDALLESGMNATILRPWYILGPGHRWPYTLIPLYWLAECIPSSRESARRLGLVTIAQMVEALVRATGQPAHGIQIVEVPQIRNARPASA